MQPSRSLDNRCEIAELAFAYALQVLPTSEVAAAEAHIAPCPDCQRELQSLGPVVVRLFAWPTDVLRPTTSPRARPALPIAEETGSSRCCRRGARANKLGPSRNGNRWPPGSNASCSRHGTAPGRHAGAPGARRQLPRHTHAEVEELHLLHGETTITVRPERATSASGARPAAPVFW